MVKQIALWTVCALTVASAAVAADGPVLRGYTRSLGFGGPSLVGQASPTPIPAVPGALDPVPMPAPLGSNYAPEQLPPGTAYPTVEDVPYAVGGPVALYENVKYRDVRKIHPCAIPMVVQVADPCKDPCNTCGPQCVNVQICVPPCECPKIKCRRHGDKVIYDFGRYEVSLTSVRGMVIVDYDN